MSKNILMPALSPTMEFGNLVNWLKKEGDKISVGDVIAEIETDKATMEVEAIDSGILGKIIVPAGSEDVKVNSPIAILIQEGESLDDVNVDVVSEVSNSDKKQENEAVSEQHQNNSKSDCRCCDRIIASPLAKKIAMLNDISLSDVHGTGPHGRIVKRDIENFISNEMVASMSLNSASDEKLQGMCNNFSLLRDKFGFPEYDVLKVSSMRKTIAKRLSESKREAPHFYLTVPIEIDELLRIRKIANERYESKMTVNDFIIKAVAMTLIKVPEANRSWNDTEVRQFHTADVAVAVAIDDGLITPVIRSAEHKGVLQISTEMKDLSSRAKVGKLKPEEFSGGTFSISNLGMFGVEQFGAVINPPHGAILAVGKGMETPVVQDGDITIATVMKCTLSVDHRVVDGVVGAKFLKQLKEYIENPAIMLI